MGKVNNLIEEIDIIFFKLKDDKSFLSSDSFTVVFLNKKIPIKKEKIEVILDFLFDEGYVSKRQIHVSVFEYRINIKGLLFNGYKDKGSMDAISNRNARIQTLLLVRGTSAAGVYSVFEVLKWFFHHEHWKLFF
jgi:hypothetical protein